MSSPVSRIGSIVQYTMTGIPVDPRLNREVVNPVYPAIIYKVHEDPRYVGLYVFTDTGLRQMRMVVYNQNGEPETWR